LGNCENFVGKRKREKLAFDTFSDSEPVERALDGSDMIELRSFNDALNQLKYWPTVVRVTLTDRVSA